MISWCLVVKRFLAKTFADFIEMCGDGLTTEAYVKLLT